jgi:hypothetical protein
MSDDTNPAAVYAKLRAEAARLLNLDADKMSPLESMHCDLVSVLMLELGYAAKRAARRSCR